jgi:uncharacterized protein
MPYLSHPESLTITEEILFPAGPNLLHGELSYPEVGRARGAVVFAGPHPLLGGNMRNNVVRFLGDGLAQKDLLTLRFDYRGVGRSQGPRLDIARHLAEFWQTSHAPGEMDFWQDLQGAIDFVQQAFPGLPLALIGYSFGCALLPHVQTRAIATAWALIAPTVAKHDYSTFLSIKTPMLVVASEDDFATNSDQLDTWFGSLSMPRELVRRRCDNHFFRGHEDWVLEVVIQFLKNTGGIEP